MRAANAVPGLWQWRARLIIAATGTPERGEHRVGGALPRADRPRLEEERGLEALDMNALRAQPLLQPRVDGNFGGAVSSVPEDCAGLGLAYDIRHDGSGRPPPQRQWDTELSERTL